MIIVFLIFSITNFISDARPIILIDPEAAAALTSLVLGFMFEFQGGSQLLTDYIST